MVNKHAAPGLLFSPLENTHLPSTLHTIALALALFMLAQAPSSHCLGDPTTTLGHLADSALEAAANGDFSRAIAKFDQVERLLEGNSDTSDWRQLRLRQFSNELRQVLEYDSKDSGRVHSFVKNLFHARKLAARNVDVDAEKMAAAAYQDLLALNMDLPELRFTIGRLYLVAASSLPTNDKPLISRDELEELAATNWGRDSWQFGVASCMRLYHESAILEKASVPEEEIRMARELVRPIVNVTSDEYLLSTLLLANNLLLNHHADQSLTVCDESMALIESGVISKTEAVFPAAAIRRCRGTALADLSHFEASLRDFDSSRRHAYGMIPNRFWLRHAIEAEQRAILTIFKREPKEDSEWRFRKEVAATGTGRFLRVAKRWTSDSTRSNRAEKESNCASAISIALSEGDFTRAMNSIARCEREHSGACCATRPIFDSNWLIRDLRKCDIRISSNEVRDARRAIRLVWKSFLGDDSVDDQICAEGNRLSSALRNCFGADSESLWHFHRTLARVYRKRGLFSDARREMGVAHRVLSQAERFHSPAGVVQSTEELVLFALMSHVLSSMDNTILVHEIRIPEVRECINLSSNETLALAMYCVNGRDIEGAEAFAGLVAEVQINEKLRRLSDSECAMPLAQAIRATAYAHYGETERAEKEFASMKLALEGGEGIRAPELRWFALKLYADFLEKEGKTARAKKIRQLSEAELPDRERR